MPRAKKPRPISRNEEIRTKYLKAPTNEMIFAFVDEMGVSYRQFERFFGLYYGCLKSIKWNVNKELPVRFWPIFYERMPKSELDRIYYKKHVPHETKVKKTKPSAKKEKPKEISPSILNKLRDIQN
jgi:hypothetical protein